MASVSQVVEIKEKVILGEEDRPSIDVRIFGDGSSLSHIPFPVSQGKGWRATGLLSFFYIQSLLVLEASRTAKTWSPL